MKLARGTVVAADGAVPIAERPPRVVEVLPAPVHELELAVRMERERERVVSLATAMAVRLVGDAVARDDRALAALFDEVRSAVGPAARVSVRVSPVDAPRLAPRLAELGVAVEVDHARPAGSMRVDSDRGAAELSIDDAVRRIAEGLPRT